MKEWKEKEKEEKEAKNMYENKGGKIFWWGRGEGRGEGGW